MSEITTVDIEKKADAWRRFGVVIANSELQFQARAQAIIAKLKKPTGMEDLSDAENTLKLVKQDANKLAEDRIAITSRFDSVKKRLMDPEKSIVDAIPEIEKAIFDIRKAEQERAGKQKAKIEEQKRVKELFLTEAIKMDSQYKQKISDQVVKAFNYALGKGSVTIVGLPEYLAKVKAANGFSEYDFTWDMPSVTLIYNTREEILPIWQEVDKTITPGSQYVADYHKKIDDQFEFFTTALKNKEAAIKLQKENAEREAEELAKAARAKETVVKLDAIATTTAEIVSGAKPLKEYYEVDMEDTDQNAIKIIAAFVGNFELCRPGVRVKSMLKISVEQMASALAWVKNKDDKFQCGVNFVKKEKL